MEWQALVSTEPHTFQTNISGSKKRRLNHPKPVDHLTICSTSYTTKSSIELAGFIK